MSLFSKLFIQKCLTGGVRFSSQHAIKNVTVIGGGIMGGGIAQVAAQTGHNVTLVDINDDVLKHSKSKIENSLKRVAKKLYANEKEKIEKFQNDTMNQLKFSTSLTSAVESADLVIEAIIENVEMKHKIFSQIDSISPQHTIFATNTSSFLVKDIAKVTKRLDRFGGLHFFNPVTVMKLVEIIRMPETSQQTHEILTNFGKSLGKTTVEANDTKGFIVNRLLIPFLFDSIRMLERGDATVKDIDTAMKLGAGHPMGPFELMDYIGLDTCKFSVDGWHKSEPDNKLYEPSPLLDRLVAEGKLGVKSGQGFHTYTKK